VTRWRVIGTDSESFDGVAPICQAFDAATNSPLHGEHDVEDCCRGPHLRIPASTGYSREAMAPQLARALTDLRLDNLEICD
jgi:hypothetical protein